MPKPVGDSSAYVPGLDGIRALAVLAVLGYHLGLPHFSGGLLGVGVFFTLSGFLITRILLASWARTGTLELRRFWLHRARRLLPALGLVLAVVLAGTALTDRGPGRALGRDLVGGGVRRELAHDRRGRVVLRALRRPRPARPPVVARRSRSSST